MDDSIGTVGEANSLGAIEWDGECYRSINTDRLVTNCPELVFEDTYGDGVAYYTNESISDYHTLSKKAGLNIESYYID